VSDARCLPIQTNPKRASRVCAKAVDFARSVPLAEPDTLEGSPHTTLSLPRSYHALTASYCWNLIRAESIAEVRVVVGKTPSCSFVSDELCLWLDV
jgi:hypothetical protein